MAQFSFIVVSFVVLFQLTEFGQVIVVAELDCQDRQSNLQLGHFSPVKNRRHLRTSCIRRHDLCTWQTLRTWYHKHS